VDALPVTTPFVAPEELARQTGIADIVRLGANESNFGPSPRAVEAMTRAVAQTWMYGDPESYELRTRLAQIHGCDLSNISVGAGIDDLLGLTVRTYMEPGQAVVTTSGSYPTFNYHVAGYGGRIEAVLYRDHGCIDLDALAAKARAVRPALVYLANPDNPSGTLAPARDVERLIEAIPPQSLLILDEAYADFASTEEIVADGVLDGVIRLRTFSKAHGMAGARVGYALASADVVTAFQKIRLHFGVNWTAQIGARASLDDPGHVAQTVRGVREGRDEYYALARELGLGFIPSHTNFVCIDLGSTERAQALVGALLALGVFIRKPGAPPLDRFVRVSVGSPADRARFARALPQALERLGQDSPVAR